MNQDRLTQQQTVTSTTPEQRQVSRRCPRFLSEDVSQDGKKTTFLIVASQMLSVDLCSNLD